MTSRTRSKVVTARNAVAAIAIVALVGCGSGGGGVRTVERFCAELAATDATLEAKIQGLGTTPADVQSFYDLMHKEWTRLASQAPPEAAAAAAQMAQVVDELRTILKRSGYDFAAAGNDPDFRAVTSRGEAADNAIEQFRVSACGATSGPSSGGPNWQNGTELSRATLTSGEVVRFVETADHNYLCVVRGEAPTGCIGVGPRSVLAGITGPQYAGAAVGSGVFPFGLPEGFPAGVKVRDENGVILPSAVSTSGLFLVVFDVSSVRTSSPASLQGAPSRSFEILSAEGKVVARASVPATVPPNISTTVPGSPSNSSASSTPQALASCLRAQGVAVPELNPSALPTQTSPSNGGATIAAFPPALSERAWQACRSIISAQSDDMRAYLDCMASQGWFPSVMAGYAPADLNTFNSAAARCKANVPSTRDTVVCLRAQGLTVVDPASAPNYAPPPQQFEPAAADAAWKSCRGIAIAAQGLPAELAARSLSFADCMAGKGWITFLVTGPPTGPYDEVAYATARSSCP